MTLFTPYKPPVPLPPEGDGFEHATLDLKARADVTKTFHLAKDVAAFANHLGGTLIIGAEENTGRVGRYVPLTESEANSTQDAFSKAVAKRCSPRPLIDFGRYPVNGGFVLTVLAWPFIAQPVGVMVNADKNQGGYGGDDAYAFPVRSGSDSAFILPEQLAMYMMPEIRRVALAMSQILSGSQIRLHSESPQAGKAPFSVKFLSANLAQNAVNINIHCNTGDADVSLPFDAVRAVWLAGSTWQLAIRGQILNDNLFHWVG